MRAKLWGKSCATPVGVGGLRQFSVKRGRHIVSLVEGNVIGLARSMGTPFRELYLNQQRAHGWDPTHVPEAVAGVTLRKYA